MEIDVIKQGNSVDVLKTFPDESIDCCITSPPYYGLRDYGMEDQIGLEETPEIYIQRLVDVFHEVKRVLKKDGTLWLNIADSYWGSGSRGYDFTGKMSEASKLQSNSKGTINLSRIPKLVGNTETGIKNKDLIGIPWMLAFALRTDGWYLRQDIIWHKPNPMPESVTDRCTKSHEYIFLLSKNSSYYFDYESIEEAANIQNVSDHIKFGGNKYGDNDSEKYAIYSGNEYKPKTKNCKYDGQRPNTMHLNREKGQQDKEYLVRRKRDVWSVNVQPTKEAHFATFPENLIKPCVLAGCRRGGVILDPFFGSGTTGRVALHLNRHYIGIELNPEYIDIAHNRTSNVQMSLVGLIEGVKV